MAGNVETAIALIMAGGRSLRMRATLGPAHKSMVSISGLTLFERNLSSLITQGFRNIHAVISSQEPSVQEFVLGQASRLAKHNGVELSCVLEKQPLGNIGAARLFIGASEPILVTYVDNLSTLDLIALVAHHRKNRAAMTIAVHEHASTMPYGEVQIVDERIDEYREKPVCHTTISSGFFVIEPKACEYIPKDCCVNVVDFFGALKSAGEPVIPFKHTSLWVDVNDAANLTAAETLISDNPEVFTRYHRSLLKPNA